MRGKILVMLLIAVLCGGGSLLAARSWVNGQTFEQAAAVTAAQPTGFTTLVVAAEPLRFGTPLAARNLKTIPWPDRELPPGAFTRIEDLVSGEPRTVLYPMEPSEPVLAGKVTGPGERAGLSRLISEGRRAVTIRVNDVAGVAGFVLPGDRVDVVLTTQDGATTATDVILQGVKVLTIDQIADERTEEPMVARAVTVEVDPAGAQKIALAQTIGQISLTLRPSGDVTPAEVATITPSDFGSGHDVDVAAAPPPVATAPAAAVEKPAEKVATVSVHRALESTEYRVPAGARPAAPPVVASADAAVDAGPAADDVIATADPAPVRAAVVRPAPVPAAAVRASAPAPAPTVRPTPAAVRDVAVTGSTLLVPGHILDLPQAR